MHGFCWVHVTPLDSSTHICQNSFMSLFQKFSKLALSFKISLVPHKMAQQMPQLIYVASCGSCCATFCGIGLIFSFIEK